MRDLVAGELRDVVLPTGVLRVGVDEALWPLDALCDFAARDNPKRGFLVVSKVLGRHWPATPATMRASARDLATLVPADLPGPVAVVGLAETAVCLGQTVHEELRRATGRDDIAFIHSTRQRADRPLLCRFEEPHSHASAHLIYRPDFPAPRALVLVDDEVSTGTTLANLAGALVEAWPSVEAVVVATLTDWSGGGAWLRRMPRPATCVSLLAGTLAWQPDPEATTGETLARFDAAAASLGRVGEANHGRFGIVEPLDTPPANPPTLPPAARVRVVGTGEFTFLPFRFAERLERNGHDVVVQATSRSPARIGGAIRGALAFADNYATGVPNYLYNADPDGDQVTLICHETPPGTVDPALLAALGARPLHWNDR